VTSNIAVDFSAFAAILSLSFVDAASDGGYGDGRFTLSQLASAVPVAASLPPPLGGLGAMVAPHRRKTARSWSPPTGPGIPPARRPRPLSTRHRRGRPRPDRPGGRPDPH
jgi:hypothetical protein